MVQFELSEEQVEEFKSAFSIYSKDAEGTITMKDLHLVMRSEGMRHIAYNMPDQEINDMI